MLASGHKPLDDGKIPNNVEAVVTPYAPVTAAGAITYRPRPLSGWY